MQPAFRPISLSENYIRHRDVEQHLETFRSRWAPEHDVGEGLNLFHYTTAQGLLGIIDSRSFWSTRAGFLNDALEVRYGRDMAMGYIKKAEELYPETPGLLNMLDAVKTRVDNLDGLMHEVYVTCFCTKGDLLSQWRGYADTGGGYSLKLRFTPLTQIHSFKREEIGASQPLQLRRVIYDADQQHRLMRDLIIGVCERCAEVPSACSSDSDDTSRWFSAGLGVFNAVADLILSFKHTAFEEEGEWRLVRTPTRGEAVPQRRFRAVNGQLVPYIVSPISEAGGFPMRHVLCGPGLHAERATYAVRQLIQTASVSSHAISIDFESVKVEHSAVPFLPR